MPVASVLAGPAAQTIQIVRSYLDNPRLNNLKNIVLIVFVFKLLSHLNTLFIVHGLSRTYHEVRTYLAALAFKYVKKLPSIKSKLDRELKQAVIDIENKIAPQDDNHPRYTVLPPNGLTRDEMSKELDRYRELPHTRWEDGRVSGAVYHHNKDLSDLAVQAYRKFSSSNPLHPEVFPGTRKMEAEVCAMVSEMFHAPPDSGAIMTSGGTESILMSCKAHREWGYETKGITEPEIVAPITIHAAFNKAANYFKMKIVLVPIDPVTMQADMKAVKRAINKNTVLLAGSAVNYPHGVMDDIEALGKLAQKHNIGFHVDCCLGSFMIAFAEKAGYQLPLFDFRVPGVTAISCDTHKYGFAPKGTSIIMYHSRELRRYQYFSLPTWPGGIYASPSVAGSRPGALIAGCWATMLHLGEAGYIKECKHIIDAQIKVRKAIEAIPSLYIYGDPKTSVVAFNSDKFNIYDISDQLSKRGWHLSALQSPPGIHFTSTIPTANSSDEFIADLQAVMRDFRDGKVTEAGSTAGVYGMAATVPSSVVSEVAFAFVDAMYKP
ncbi:hypothetical protein BGZ99_000025 [Dissophora globulifera]|uniref:sphinganine-1-phosphate aldolase n=1 Tax=Dissophora globulifera TaxID=979702 RepID=A0A9P6RXL0_9FUNG|nr:hypothetical protein BGZ99_000025 [Dissophora globulifera]